MKLRVSHRDNLDRYYLFQVFGFGVFIHHIHHDEANDVFHSHPWNGISFIFGRYLEERFGQSPKLRIGFNVIRADRFHRVSLPYGSVWSVFFHAKRKTNHQWTVMHRDGHILDVEPWRGIGGRTSYTP